MSSLSRKVVQKRFAIGRGVQILDHKNRGGPGRVLPCILDGDVPLQQTFKSQPYFRFEKVIFFTLFQTRANTHIYNTWQHSENLRSYDPRQKSRSILRNVYGPQILGDSRILYTT